MGISPWNVGDGQPPWTFELEPDSGAFSIAELTPSNFTLVMKNMSNQTFANGTGTFSGLTAASGNTPAMITYTLSAADAQNSGFQDMRVVANMDTPNQRTFKFGVWECVP